MKLLDIKKNANIIQHAPSPLVVTFKVAVILCVILSAAISCAFLQGFEPVSRRMGIERCYRLSYWDCDVLVLLLAILKDV